MEKNNMNTFLTYEVHSSWWAGYVRSEWGRELAATYFAWKVKRKYGRYLLSQHRRKMILKSHLHAPGTSNLMTK